MSLSEADVDHGIEKTGEAAGDCPAYQSMCGWLTQPKADKRIRLADDADGWTARSYSDLAADAHAIARRLVDEGLTPGDGACVVLPTDFPCIAAMFAVWSTGAGVTLVPPPVFGGGEEYEEHLAAILTRATPRLVVTTSGLEALVARVMSRVQMPGAPVVIDETVLDGTEDRPAGQTPAAPIDRPAIAESDIAMVQFTSGSSGTPKGVRISWRNLAANTRYILDSVAWHDEDTTVSWLPLYHDMGLVGGLLATVANQGDLYLMRPDQFVRDPLRWIRALAVAQHSVTPSFGLGYAARRVSKDEVADLDLSKFRSLIVGAEPIDPDHVQGFTTLLEETGYDPTCIRPAYGLAESTLMATVSPAGNTPVAVQIDSAALRFGAAVPILAEVEYRGQELGGGGWIVGLGGSTDASSVRVADGDGEPVAEGVLGEVVVSGESVAEGYHDEDGSAADSGGTRFLRGELWTGDAGFLHGGVLYVLGRMGSSIKVRGKSVFMEDVDARVAHETGLPKHKFAAVAMQESGAAQGIVLFVEHQPGEWIDAARKVLRADLGAAHQLTVVTGDRGLVRRTSSGKPRRRLMWELFRGGELGDITVHDAATPVAPRPERTIEERRPSSALLTDTEIGELLDRALEAVDVPADATILLEGSIAEGFGNEGSDIDFLAVSPGDDNTPEMPTVLFVGGRRVEVRTRSEAQVRAQLEYARSGLTPDSLDDTALLDLNQDVLNRCQRFSRAAVVRTGSVDLDGLRACLPAEEVGAVLARWWHGRAEQSLRQAVAMNAVDARSEALGWARDGLLQAVKGWAARRGETYLESKWIGPQLERIGDAAVTDAYFALVRALLRGDATVAEALELAESLGVSVPNDQAMVVLARIRGVTSWPIDGRIHVVRADSDVFALSDRGAQAWRSVVFGRSLHDIAARWSEPLHAELAEFVRLGLVSLRWGRRGPALRPAVAMVKPHHPYTPTPSSVVPVLGLRGATCAEAAIATLVPMPARRFTECASSLVWSNVIVENAREDLVGALAQQQGRVADVAADRMLKGAVRLLLSVLGCSPLPPDVAAVATLERLIPRGADRRDELLAELQEAQLVTFAEPGRVDAETGLAILDTFVDSVRAMAKLQFPASFDSHEQWRRTLEIVYDWLRLAAYLDAELPIDEVQDLLSSGGAQPHQRDKTATGEKK
ncbi:MAG: AMP-binding protein [Rhodococcus sp.]|nr:AMP-binding protein [Rhodococcus sp. (in: high G+C Gram-positive bacteria)]